MAELNRRHILQLSSPLFRIGLDPLAWVTVAQRLECKGRLILHEAPSVRNYAE